MEDFAFPSYHRGHRKGPLLLLCACVSPNLATKKHTHNMQKIIQFPDEKSHVVLARPSQVQSHLGLSLLESSFPRAEMLSMDRKLIQALTARGHGHTPRSRGGKVSTPWGRFDFLPRRGAHHYREMN